MFDILNNFQHITETTVEGMYISQMYGLLILRNMNDEWPVLFYSTETLKGTDNPCYKVISNKLHSLIISMSKHKGELAPYAIFKVM